MRRPPGREAGEGVHERASPSALERAKRVRLLAMDVDGPSRTALS
jgi:hypothetical protein